MIKAPKSPEFIDSSREGEEEGPPKGKKVKKVGFMRGPYEGYELSRVALYDTEYLRGVLKSGLDKKKKT